MGNDILLLTFLPSGPHQSLFFSARAICLGTRLDRFFPLSYDWLIAWPGLFVQGGFSRKRVPTTQQNFRRLLTLIWQQRREGRIFRNFTCSFIVGSVSPHQEPRAAEEENFHSSAQTSPKCRWRENPPTDHSLDWIWEESKMFKIRWDKTLPWICCISLNFTNFEYLMLSNLQGYIFVFPNRWGILKMIMTMTGEVLCH